MFGTRSDLSVTPLVTSGASLPTSGAFPNKLHLWSISCRTRVPYPRASFSQSREDLYSVLSFLGLRCLGNLLRAPTHFPRTTGFYPQALKRGTRSVELIEERAPQSFHALAGCTAKCSPGGREESPLASSSPALLTKFVAQALLLSMWFRLLKSRGIRELRNQVQLPRFKIRKIKLNRSIASLRSHN